MPPVTSQSPTRHDARTITHDALPRVSYRERRLAVPAEDPAPGRYLELEDGDERVLLPIRAGTRSSTSGPGRRGSSTTAARTGRSSTGAAWPTPSCRTATSWRSAGWC